MNFPLHRKTSPIPVLHKNFWSWSKNILENEAHVTVKMRI